MKKSTTVSIVIVLVIVIGWLVFFRVSLREVSVSQRYDGFARCLTERGFTMYGAYWCPHCQNEKAAFGDSFRQVHYVECTEEPKLCTAAGIEKFPTWLTSDGRKFEGEQGIERLAEISGCSLSVPSPSFQEGEQKRELR